MSASLVALQGGFRVGRGFLVAVFVSLGVLYTAWLSHQKRQRIRRAMRSRQQLGVEPTPQTNPVRALVVKELELLTQEELTHLSGADSLSNLLHTRDARVLIGRLEDRFDISLPDSRRVRQFTLDELVSVVQRAIEREHSGSDSEAP
jgi:acyl carrier protein